MMKKLGHHRRAAFTERLREIVFGLGHGLVSLVGLTTGLAAGGASRPTIIFAGLVSLFTGAVTLFSEEYLAAKSQREVWEHWLERERQEFKSFPGEEIEEMCAYYAERGFTDEETKIILNRLMQDIDVWLEAHAVHVLRFIPPEPGRPSADALFMSGFHILGAAVPILPYLFLPVRAAVPVSIVLAAVCLFVAGAFKTRVTGKRWQSSGAEMLAVAAAAVLVGFAVGRLVPGL